MQTCKPCSTGIAFHLVETLPLATSGTLSWQSRPALHGYFQLASSLGEEKAYQQYMAAYSLALSQTHGHGIGVLKQGMPWVSGYTCC